MKYWEAFERRIVHDIRLSGHFITRIPTGARVIKIGGAVQFKGQKTAFDFAAAVNGRAVFFDAKCMTSGERFNIRSLVLSPKKIHQYQALLDAAQSGGAVAGYLIWWFNERLITFVDVLKLRDLIVNTEVKSITPETFPSNTYPDHMKIDVSQWASS